MLIKLVLSSLPLYQGSVLLAQKMMTEFPKNLRKLMWQGGKRNEIKFHLVGWRIVNLGNEKGGLAIKDLHLMNLALGAKLVWALVNNS